MSGEISPSAQPSGEVSPARLRASHADRDQVVDALTAAAGEGRLTAEELDERVEAALAARTLGELAPLTADLPALPAAATGSGAPRAKDVGRIETRFSTVKREGRWVVPRRLEINAQWSAVTLDFTQAVITHDVLRIDLVMLGKNLLLLATPGMIVDAEELTLAFSRLKLRRAPRPERPVTLRVELAGRKEYGRVLVRYPRRGA